MLLKLEDAQKEEQSEILVETYNNNLELMMILRKEKAEEERQIEVERIKAQERAEEEEKQRIQLEK